MTHPAAGIRRTNPDVVGVFGGGGAKAAAHIGALQAMEEVGIRPTRLLGTSMGAVFATLFASGLSAREALERVGMIGEREIVRSEPLAFLKGLWARNLLRPEPFRRALERMLGARRFQDLRFPLTVTATALDTGELALFGAGGVDVPLIDALAASCALPLFFPPVMIEGRPYADGGLRAVLPLEPASAIPARLVIAVDVGPGFDDRDTSADSGVPPLVAIHNQADEILMAGQTEAHLALWRLDPRRAHLVYIRPLLDRGGTFRVDQVDRYVEVGYEAARHALAHLNSGPG
jgi:NTE family protein